MRYSLEHKAQNHENILSVAARSFREHGGDSSGIGTVMKKVGLTKGGFYRHFKSKDDLFVEAVARAFDEMERGMLEVARSAPKVRLCGLSSNVISARPREFARNGLCGLRARARARASPYPVRRRIEASREAYRERLLPFVPGQDARRKSGEVSAVVPPAWLGC